MPIFSVVALSESGAAASFDVAAIMQSAVTSVQGDLFKVLGIVVPAAVTIVGASVAVKYGIRWLKSLKGA
mgnify:CR=1 FL=1